MDGGTCTTDGFTSSLDCITITIINLRLFLFLNKDD